MNMPQPISSSWRDKARSLDRFRWRQLRARHGWLGSVVRFARDMLVDSLVGCAAWLRVSASVANEPCDLLLLQSTPAVILLRRKKRLIETLRQRGHCLTETALESRWVLLAGKRFVKPPQPVPLRYFAYAAHAEWLVRKYQPRILLNDRNGSLYAPFLRLSLNVRNRCLVQLAHASALEQSRRLDMCDYDYYFVFGQTSLEALMQRKLRFGDTEIVLAGSHMIDTSYALPSPRVENKTLLLLGVGPDREKVQDFLDCYALVRAWAEQHPDYRLLVKLHPRSDGAFWRDCPGNIQVLPIATTLVEALMQASMVVNVMSNAVLEAGLAGRPVLPVRLGSIHDLLSQDRFFGEPLQDVEALAARILMIEVEYADQVARAREFAEYHLAHGCRGLEETVRLLETMLQDCPLPSVTLRAVPQEMVS